MDDKGLVYATIIGMTYILISISVKMIKYPEKRKIVHQVLLFVYSVFYGAVMYSCVTYLIN